MASCAARKWWLPILLTSVILGFAPAGPASAQRFNQNIEVLAERVAEALRLGGHGQDGAADVYVRPPFDDVYRVVCAPLSRRLAREIRAQLPRAFARKELDRARVVQRQASGSGQFTLNVSWRDIGEQRVEIAFELGDLSGDQVATLDGGTVEIAKSELREAERACLAKLDVINRVATAEEPLFVHRSANIFSAEIGRIAKGEEYRLLGRMPYTNGDWAVVKMMRPKDRDDPFAETVGFATVPLPESPQRQAEPEPDPEAPPEPKPDRAAEPEPDPDIWPDPVPQPAPETDSRLVGNWQCFGNKPVNQQSYMQLAFQIQFEPGGGYTMGGQATVYASFNNQMLTQTAVGEYGRYRFAGQILSVSPQGSMPVMPLSPYQVTISNLTAASLTMIDHTDNAQYQCQRLQ